MKKVIFQNIPFEAEEKLVQQYCKNLDIPYECLSIKDILKQKLVSQENLIVGNIPFIKQALQSVKIKITDDSYPEEFSALLHRRIYKTLIKKLSFEKPVFIKPSKNLKKFTGKIIYSKDDLYGLPLNEEIYVSELIDIKAEYRLYISNKQIVHISQYEGDIQDICITNIQELIDSQNKYHNFIMDISIDHQNKISLLEINDAFSIGAYKDISPETYTTLLDNRWKEFFTPLSHL